MNPKELPANLHCISASTDTSVLLNPDTLELFVAQPEGTRGSLSIPHQDYPAPGNKTQLSSINSTHQTGGKPRLSRLTLNISNTCNLACAYCYASKGSYGLPSELMESTTALNLLSRAFSTFDIDNLMFFGGEPSLNLDVILDCCIFVQAMYDRGMIQTLPGFGLISNFYGPKSRFERLIAIAKEFGIAFTASVDGPSEIHDANRHTRSGRASYEIVRRNLLHAQNAGVPVNIECTYTKEHIEHGVHVVDLMQFFFAEYGLNETHIAPASGAQKLNLQQTVDEFCEAIKYMVIHRYTNSLAFSIGERLLMGIANREPIGHYCPAGMTELAIGPQGNWFPCFMFVGNNAFDMGSVNEPRVFASQRQTILEQIHQNSKEQRSSCQECWSRNLCSGCIGADYYETGSLDIRPGCCSVHAMAAEAIVRMTEGALHLPWGYLGNEHRFSEEM